MKLPEGLGPVSRVRAGLPEAPKPQAGLGACGPGWSPERCLTRGWPVPPPARPLGQRLREAWARGAEDAGWTGRPAWQCRLWRCAGELSQSLWVRAEAQPYGLAGALRGLVGRLTAGAYGAWGALSQRLKPIPIPPPLAPEPLGPALPPFPTRLGWLKAEGPRLLTEAGQSLRLRGLNRAGFEYLAQPKAEALLPDPWLRQVAASGATWLRLPINQERALTDEGYRQELDEALRRASAHGLYLAMDMHWAKAGGGQVEHANADTLRLWRLLAHRYQHQPAFILDLHNEPGFHSWAEQAALSEAILREVRAVNPKALALVEGTAKAQDLSGVLRRPVRDPNVAYQVHAYGPKQHLAGVGPAQWEALFGRVAQAHPVILGEFGGDDEERGAMEAVLRFAEARGLAGWAWWPDHAHQAPVDAEGQLSPWGRWWQAQLHPQP